ncbi:MAG: hypothetical protein JNM25_00500 [Planctomycetes bacterium]|nr:hypothetical protein [Planctomycetota bacterium]
MTRAQSKVVPPPDPATGPASVRRRLDAVHGWWRAPRLNAWVVLLLGVAIVSRNPSTVHTPQLWAEDGTIFLVQADWYGLEAFVMPHVGYLHLLQRLIAWSAPQLLDPLWWPAYYNGVALVIWLLVAARCFSPRLPVPGRLWLALSLVAVPHAGEVFFCVTNLQWVTALVLVQQALVLPPANWRQRLGDLAIVSVLVLTGPFGAAFSPLYVWRWWRQRSADNTVLLATVLLGAAIQIGHVLQMGQTAFQALPVNVWAILEVLVRRVVLWPVLGTDLTLGLSPQVVRWIGGAVLAAIFVWALRPHPRRGLRAQFVAAFLLISVASIYRARPDLWAGDNLMVVDRYFYVPRVLLAWLLIAEFDSRPRAIAYLARAFCLVAVVVHARDYVLPAPRDYDWASHCEAIRRGEPADIPILPEGWILEYRGRPAGRR